VGIGNTNEWAFELYIVRMRATMSEKEFAIILANKVLDRINADPDDDLAVLARQLLRALERLGEYQPDDSDG
jgi:hypothetical protein